VTGSVKPHDEHGALDVLGDAHPVMAELVGASKRFDAIYAVRDVSLQIRAGEVLALVGENGAGKSTCVKMLGGVYHPTDGVVRVGGEDVALRTERCRQEHLREDARRRVPPHRRRRPGRQ